MRTRTARRDAIVLSVGAMDFTATLTRRDEFPCGTHTVQMLRTTIAIIEFCSLLDDGSFEVTHFPDSQGNIGTTPTCYEYVDAARWYLETFPSRLTDEQLNTPDLLPCAN